MNVLAIETSCDETAAAIVKDGREVLAEIVASQIPIHEVYGGVVPEIASRKHVETISPLIDELFQNSGMGWDDVDVIAATRGPGLVGALLVGLTAGKTYAYALDKPFKGVNHIEGHICANYVSHPELEPPFVGLVVSGGHTYLLDVKDYVTYEVIGQTRDDAAGEVFDKVGRSLGLPYPGGPHIDAKAKEGNAEAIAFPRVMLEKNSYDFSFSGLKTAVLNELNKRNQKGEDIVVEDVAASFQQAVIDVLVEKTFRLVKELNYDKVALSGGVAANSGLREALEERGRQELVEIFYPPGNMCTDNAAMIASAAYFHYKDEPESDFDVGVDPNLGI